MRLADRAAIVTGGSRGIGRAVALALGREGAAVLVNYVAAEGAAREVVERIRGLGGRAEAVRADVRDFDAAAGLVAEALARFGRVDVLVNNAGIVRDKPVTFMTPGEWTEVIDVDLTGAFHCIKAAGREMVRRKSGRIVNISSDAGLMGDLMRANYSAAKAGLLGLTKAVAREFAGSGVTVNAVAPGIVETDLIAGMAGAKRERMLAAIPMARFGRPEEVAGAVLFLASDEAAYITGEVLCVDGGLNTR
jgi:3-oxoacyl-[acyl-carrier protein] reductase